MPFWLVGKRGKIFLASARALTFTANTSFSSGSRISPSSFLVGSRSFTGKLQSPAK